MARRLQVTKDPLVVTIFAVILAVLSAVNIRTLHQNYEQTERIRTVNQFVDCLDPTTQCGKKLANYQEAQQEFLTRTMRSQAICTLLTSRTLRGTDDMNELERVYRDCVTARTGPAPEPPPRSPIEEEEG